MFSQTHMHPFSTHTYVPTHALSLYLCIDIATCTFSHSYMHAQTHVPTLHTYIFTQAPALHAETCEITHPGMLVERHWAQLRP